MYLLRLFVGLLLINALIAIAAGFARADDWDRSLRMWAPYTGNDAQEGEVVYFTGRIKRVSDKVYFEKDQSSGKKDIPLKLEELPMPKGKAQCWDGKMEGNEAQIGIMKDGKFTPRKTTKFSGEFKVMLFQGTGRIIPVQWVKRPVSIRLEGIEEEIPRPGESKGWVGDGPGKPSVPSPCPIPKDSSGNPLPSPDDGGGFFDGPEVLEDGAPWTPTKLAEWPACTTLVYRLEFETYEKKDNEIGRAEQSRVKVKEYLIPLKNGLHTIHVMGERIQGEMTAPSKPVVIMVDAPVRRPEITNPLQESLISYSTPDVAGQGCSPLAFVSVYVDDNLVGLISAGEDGRFSMTLPSPLCEGIHMVFVEATDTTGNIIKSDAISFTVDTLPPETPIIIYPRQLDVTTLTPIFSGITEPGSTVTILMDGIPEGFTMADFMGNFAFAVPVPLLPGWHTVSAQAQDAAGNTSPLSSVVEFMANP